MVMCLIGVVIGLIVLLVATKIWKPKRLTTVEYHRKRYKDAIANLRAHKDVSEQMLIDDWEVWRYKRRKDWEEALYLTANKYDVQVKDGGRMYLSGLLNVSCFGIRLPCGTQSAHRQAKARSVGWWGLVQSLHTPLLARASKALLTASGLKRRRPFTSKNGIRFESASSLRYACGNSVLAANASNDM